MEEEDIDEDLDEDDGVVDVSKIQMKNSFLYFSYSTKKKKPPPSLRK